MKKPNSNDPELQEKPVTELPNGGKVITEVTKTKMTFKTKILLGVTILVIVILVLITFLF